MTKVLFFLMFIYSNIYNFICYADYHKTQTFKSKNSECRVEASAGEYPNYTVIKGKKIIFKKDESASDIVFSVDGKYIAIGDTNMGPVDVGKEQYHLAIINCKNEKVKGYLDFKDRNTESKDGWTTFVEYVTPSSFSEDNSQLKYTANITSIKEKTTKERTENLTIYFDKNNLLP